VGPPLVFGLALWWLIVHYALPRVEEEPKGVACYHPNDHEWVPIPGWLGWACYAAAAVIWIPLLIQPWFGIEGAAVVMLGLYLVGAIFFMMHTRN
jgi:hypothetical protein